MPKHNQSIDSPYTAEQMFNLVLDVELYPEFLPWCTGLRIKSHEKNGGVENLVADLMVGFKVFREKFSSRVKADHKAMAIEIDYIDGPFKYLHNEWRFTDKPDGGSVVDFAIDFEFKSLALRVLISQVFDEAVRRMVGAFDQRAHAIYGADKAK